jgi:catechol 2,3-dioxygenase-like lactoylglutathione lyase family enzyme
MIRKLHHNAYRCRDSEETRAFYEDFLGLPLVGTLELGETKTGRATHTLHTFYRLDDGSHLAFFESLELPFEFKKQHDYDLHIALEAAGLYRKYKEHVAYQTPMDAEIMRIYQLIANGWLVIRAIESIKQAGLNEQGLPSSRSVGRTRPGATTNR